MVRRGDGGTDAASYLLGWRLFIPRSWDDLHAETNEQAEAIPPRRGRAQIPERVRHRPKWELAIEMLDELTTWGRRPQWWLPMPATVTPNSPSASAPDPPMKDQTATPPQGA